ncbi:MAG: PhnD/SsuA/transferrin family substrate-binding protein [Paracoccaceae bacterium]
MIATLPMYDWPQNAAANDRLWALMRAALTDEGFAAPAELTREGDLYEIWTSPDLILGQTCGMPFRMRLHDRTELVATPDYGLTGLPPGQYCSVVVTRAGEPGEIADFIDRTLAYNTPDSQSGWAAPQNHVAGAGQCFTRTLETGAHRESARAVAEGRADIAAIDAVTWRMIETYLPDLARQLRIVGTTAPTPGLPLITAKGRDANAVARAASVAIGRLLPKDRAVLGLKGLITIPASAYLGIATPPPPAQVAPLN